MTRLPPSFPRLPTDQRNFRKPFVPGITTPFSGKRESYAASASISASLKSFFARLLKIARRRTSIKLPTSKYYSNGSLRTSGTFCAGAPLAASILVLVIGVNANPSDDAVKSQATKNRVQTLVSLWLYRKESARTAHV